MTWESASTGPRVVYVLLVELQFDSVTVRIHDGVGPLVWGGQTWSGVGEFGAISAITNGEDLTATGITLTLSGVPSDFRTELLNTVSRGAPATLYHGFWNEAAGSWAHEPEAAYFGIVDRSRLVDGTDDGDPSVSIAVSLISASSYARRLTFFRRSHAHQQTLFSGDLFYQFRTDIRTEIPVTSSSAGAVIAPSDKRGGVSNRFPNVN